MALERAGGGVGVGWGGVGEGERGREGEKERVGGGGLMHHCLQFEGHKALSAALVEGPSVDVCGSSV